MGPVLHMPCGTVRCPPPFEESSPTASSNREKQTLSWVKQITEEAIRNRILSNPRVQQQLEITEKQLAAGNISATMAAQGLILAIEDELRKPDSAIS